MPSTKCRARNGGGKVIIPIRLVSEGVFCEVESFSRSYLDYGAGKQLMYAVKSLGDAIIV